VTKAVNDPEAFSKPQIRMLCFKENSNIKVLKLIVHFVLSLFVALFVAVPFVFRSWSVTEIQSRSP
jgi:hypothetical protein